MYVCILKENVCTEDTYFHILDPENYVMKHAGDPIPENAEVITKEEFGEGIKKLSGASDEKPARRTRRTRKER